MLGAKLHHPMSAVQRLRYFASDLRDSPELPRQRPSASASNRPDAVGRLCSINDYCPACCSPSTKVAYVSTTGARGGLCFLRLVKRGVGKCVVSIS